MKKLTKIIHTGVKILHAEEVLAKAGSYLPFFIKFIPLPSEYSQRDERLIKRDSTFFRVKLTDYMQWHLFANLEDISWKIAKKYLTGEGIILDIGANCGQFSLKLASYIKQSGYSSLTIHAFEPNPEIFMRLTENLKLNSSIEKLIHCHSLGLGAQNEERLFQYNPENSGSGSARANNAGQFSITIKKLDDVIDNINPLTVQFIKIDVEGFEPEVFNGAWKTIEKYRPAIFFEVTPAWYEERGVSLSNILEKLKTLGYNLFVEWRNEIIPYHKLKVKPPQYNMLAVL